MKQLIIACLGSALMLACTMTGFLESSRPPTATVAPTTPAEPPTRAPAPALTAEQIRNMQVVLQQNDQHPTVQLKDGAYKSGDDPFAIGFISANVPDVMAFGDLNHDSAEDAAVLLAENYGGTGVFTSVLAILNVNGRPVQAGAHRIDDRPMASGLAIQDGKIIFSGAIHGPNDPGCCPNVPVSEAFALTKSGLTLERFTSTTPTGTQRAITIESPQNGEQVAAGALQIKGSFTVSPFENTFACRVVDATGKEWFAGPLTVTAEMGQPGSFDEQLDLGAVPTGMLVRLEISDLSAADGSTMAMDSVEVMIK